VGLFGGPTGLTNIVVLLIVVSSSVHVSLHAASQARTTDASACASVGAVCVGCGPFILFAWSMQMSFSFPSKKKRCPSLACSLVELQLSIATRVHSSSTRKFSDSCNSFMLLRLRQWSSLPYWPKHKTRNFALYGCGTWRFVLERTLRKGHQPCAHACISSVRGLAVELHYFLSLAARVSTVIQDPCPAMLAPAGSSLLQCPSPSLPISTRLLSPAALLRTTAARGQARAETRER
jgi:hypothetical protein